MAKKIFALSKLLNLLVLKNIKTLWQFNYPCFLTKIFASNMISLTYYLLFLFYLSLLACIKSYKSKCICLFNTT